jgi:hypothetical protein
MPDMLYYPDPRGVPPDYSGCLNTWAEGGARMIEAKFENGKIRWYRIGANDVYCEYENDRVVKEIVSEEMRRAIDRLPPQLKSQMKLCPPGARLIPSKWR